MKKVQELTEQVTALLHQRKAALTFDEIAEALGSRGNLKKKLQKSLHDLTKAGQVIKIRDNRYTVGSTADLVTGTLQVLRSGHAIVASPEQNVFVPQQEQGTALPGDQVVVRLAADGRSDRPGMANGAVIRILERARHEIVGTLRSAGRFLRVVPVDPTYGRDIYVADDAGAKINDRVLCQITNWVDKAVNPEGMILESLGSSDDPSADTLAIIKHYGLPEGFPAEVVSEAEHVSGLMEKQGVRRDCRGLVTFTIDPVRARDFDDALSIEPLENGAVMLGVHIADVSHFVRQGSPLDKEAALRGNSVYLPDKVIPMLPEQLSNGICSLRPHEDRLSFSVFMTIGPDGHVTHSDFAKTVIRSQARLTYEQAMAVINGNPEAGIPAVVCSRILDLHRWAQLLRKNRFARYALDLDMPECEVVMGDNSMIKELRVVANDPSHQLVEEFMVAANEAVARELTLRGLPLISRLHEPPRVEKIEDLQIQLQGMGYQPGDLTKQRNMAAFLTKVKDEPLVHHIRMAVLRSLNRAVYSAEAGGHYGLAKTYYGHFTSPIRRYADLTVHRQLEAMLAKRPGAEAERAPPKRAAYTKGDLVPIALNVTLTEQTADEAERALMEIKKYRYLEQMIKDGKPEPLNAVVVAVMNFGIFVEIVNLQIQGLVHVSQLSDVFVQHDRGLQELRAGKKSYRVGTPIQVIPASVDFDKRKIDFVPAGEDKVVGGGGARRGAGQAGGGERRGARDARPPRREGGGGPRHGKQQRRRRR